MLSTGEMKALIGRLSTKNWPLSEIDAQELLEKVEAVFQKPLLPFQREFILQTATGKYDPKVVLSGRRD